MSKPCLVKYNGLELLCKPETVTKYREGKLSVSSTVITDIIFTNSNKGDQASASDLKKVFNTEDINSCIKTILDKGTFKLTKNELKEKVNQKRKKVCNLFNENYINPKNGLPYTITMWDSILTENKIIIDPEKSADTQMNDIKKKLLGKVAMAKVNQQELILILKHEYWGKISGTIHQLATIVRDKYLPKEVKMELQMRPADFVKISTQLNTITGGDHYFESKEAYLKSRKPEEKIMRKPAKGKNKNKKR